MNIYLAASLFILLVLIYVVISEVFTMLFRFIGLPEEKARFQVTSLLTGCGFTTRESEMLMTTKRRRRLARVTMLFGYVFNVTIVSALVNLVLSLKQNQASSYLVGILIPLAVAAGVVSLLRIGKVRSWIDSRIEKIAGRIAGRDTANSVILIDHIGKGSIAQVKLKEVPERFANVPLCNTGLKEKRNILVMLVEHKDFTVEAPSAQTVFTEGDKLTVFGDYKTICRAFDAKERFA